MKSTLLLPALLAGLALSACNCDEPIAEGEGEGEGILDDAILVVSEPLSDLADDWIEIPESTAITIADGAIERRPLEIG